MFKTIVHPTDFDEPSKEAFRVARSLAGALGARVVVYHVVPPPAIMAPDGRVILNAHAEPTDLWAGYRALQADTPKVAIQYAVTVGAKSESIRLLEEKVRDLGGEALVVLGTHGRRHGISRLFWETTVEQVVRECPCPVLIVKAAPSEEPADDLEIISAATA